MEADREVQALRLGIERIEVGMAGGPVVLDAFLEHRAGAVVLRPLHVRHRLIHAEDRRNIGPA